MQAAKRKRAPRSPRRAKAGIKTWPLYILFFAFLGLYIYTQGNGISVAFGAVDIFLIVTIIVLDFASSGRESGYFKSLMEIAIAIVIIAAFFFSLRFILKTPDPLDVVPSCSMLPALQRGDLIVLQGRELAELKAPIVNVTAGQLSAMGSGSEALVCLAYSMHGGSTSLSQYYLPGYDIGLFRFTGSGYEFANSQEGNPVAYYCGQRTVSFENGSGADIVYTTGISVNGTYISEDLNNSIVVYKTVPQDYFYRIGDTYIVHRLYAILNVSGSYYGLTKGDNNPALDMQYGNLPSSSKDVQGTIVADIPYLGYLKLLIGGQLQRPTGCNSTVLH